LDTSSFSICVTVSAVLQYQKQSFQDDQAGYRQEIPVFLKAALCQKGSVASSLFAKVIARLLASTGFSLLTLLPALIIKLFFLF
jgi:hypothetical protein